MCQMSVKLHAMIDQNTLAEIVAKHIPMKNDLKLEPKCQGHSQK